MAGDFSKSFRPEDFASYLNTNEPVLIVGGQAVNLWGYYYEDVTEEFGPLVSKDMDILGAREVLDEIANITGTKPKYFSLRPPSCSIGIISFQNDQDDVLTIDVLRSIKGASEKDLLKTVHVMEIGAVSVKVRVPAPMALLKAKIANATEIDQTNRQDEKHVRILHAILPCYLSDCVNAATESHLSERDLVNRLQYLKEIVSSNAAQGLFAKLGLSEKALFEPARQSSLQKLQEFCKHQLSSSSLG